MKKRVLVSFVGVVFLVIALVSFFEKSINIDYAFSKISLSVLAVLAGIFLFYANYDAENKPIRICSIILALLATALGLLELFSSAVPYMFSLAAPVVYYKIILLLASVSILLSNLK